MLRHLFLRGFLAEKSDIKYPMISRSWRTRWPEVIPFLKFPEVIRKVVYTTNAIESVNYSIRKVTRNRQSFPACDAAAKLIFMALQTSRKSGTCPYGNGERRSINSRSSTAQECRCDLARLHKKDYRLHKIYYKPCCLHKIRYRLSFLALLLSSNPLFSFLPLSYLFFSYPLRYLYHITLLCASVPLCLCGSHSLSYPLRYYSPKSMASSAALKIAPSETKAMAAWISSCIILSLSTMGTAERKTR